MKYRQFLFLFILAYLPNVSSGQNNFRAFIYDSATKEKIFAAAAGVDETSIGGLSDTNGNIILNNIPNGKQEIIVSLLGYAKYSMDVVFPIKNADTIFRIALLKSDDDDDLQEVTVTSSRVNSRIEDLPIKIEVIGAEDVGEETTINPANISGLLNDLAGVQVQQTSISSGNETPRLLGMDGNYTQILRDGLPLYEGFSGGFSILQLPPMDIKQIEVVKGPASTLYGGGAIAGIINIISKTPDTKPELSITLNGTTLKEGDANIYYAQRFKKFGITMFAGNTTQEYFAVNGFTIVPKLQSNLIQPTFFYYIDSATTLSLGLSSTFETRIGGNTGAINNLDPGGDIYYEENQFYRNTADIHFEKIMSNKNVFTIKGSASDYERDWQTNYYLFDGNQLSEYGEVSYLIPREKNSLVFGADYSGNNFVRGAADSTNINSYSNYTVGVFAQDDWKVIDNLTIEPGVREDYQNKYNTFFLPHLSLLYKISPAFSLRTGGGFGYKTPDILSYDLTSDEYKDYFMYVQPIGSSVTPEKSIGGNFDVNFKKYFDDITVAVTQSFFYTQINSPIILSTDPSNNTYYFSNASAPFITEGSETYLRITDDEFEAYFGYTYDYTQRKYYSQQPVNPLTPKNNFATDLAYSITQMYRCQAIGYLMQCLKRNSNHSASL